MALHHHFGQQDELECNTTKCIKPLLVTAIFYTNQATQNQYLLDDLIVITANDHQVQPFEPPKNRNIDELSEENAYLWTRFNKMQLHTLYMHLQVPDEIWTTNAGGRCYFFMVKKFSLCLLTKKNCESWIQMIPDKFGGNPKMHQLCSIGLSIIVSQPFTTRYLGVA